MNGHGEIDPEELNEKGCEFGRVLKREVATLRNSTEGDVKEMKKDIAEIIDNLQNRPSWSIAILLTTMSSLIVGLSVALIAG